MEDPVPAVDASRSPDAPLGDPVLGAEMLPAPDLLRADLVLAAEAFGRRALDLDALPCADALSIAEEERDSDARLAERSLCADGAGGVSRARSPSFAVSTGFITSSPDFRVVAPFGVDAAEREERVPFEAAPVMIGPASLSCESATFRTEPLPLSDAASASASIATVGTTSAPTVCSASIAA
jgi:hypothetical protein